MRHPTPWDNTGQQTHKLLSGLNPNPTSGFVTGTFYEPVSSAFIEVNSMEGIAVATLTLSQLCSSFTMDLSALIPGTYIVTIRVAGLVEGYTLIRM
ncbi:T9SS type A sorting domain-containing protein [Rurimicrobium arvi]|uniref:T9SS type A sorting domain-containing protein n=1 Tax=Rurimicrobium arvi TaxID=2049916 RepID=A0ABP8N1T8_9BACT